MRETDPGELPARRDRLGEEAKNIVFRKGMYRLSNAAHGVAPDIVNNLWDPVEKPLPAVIRRLGEVRGSVLMAQAEGDAGT